LEIVIDDEKKAIALWKDFGDLRLENQTKQQGKEDATT
jgi:hypothetical protein